jgi:ABC-2 type transport system ATP-binding protein
MYDIHNLEAGMTLLAVDHLTKRYESFVLDNVSFTLEPGYIMGFIGRNGAGKTTTLKAIMNLVHPDAGKVSILGRDFRTYETELKQDIGFMLGEVAYYPRTRLARLTASYRRFYRAWDERAYRGYVAAFDLDETKRVEQLSSGMRVKYALALALSHGAKLLILDEPTSGLDPVSRDEVLDVFRSVIEDGTRGILFSTHITSDLDKCADYITYIADGHLVASQERDDFVGAYRVVKGTKAQFTDEIRRTLIGHKLTDLGFTGLVRADTTTAATTGLTVEPADIETIMIYHERGSHPMPQKIQE